MGFCILVEKVRRNSVHCLPYRVSSHCPVPAITTINNLNNYRVYNIKLQLITRQESNLENKPQNVNALTTRLKSGVDGIPLKLKPSMIRS